MTRKQEHALVRALADGAGPSEKESTDFIWNVFPAVASLRVLWHLSCKLQVGLENVQPNSLLVAPSCWKKRESFTGSTPAMFQSDSVVTFLMETVSRRMTALVSAYNSCCAELARRHPLQHCGCHSSTGEFVGQTPMAPRVSYLRPPGANKTGCPCAWS